MVSVQSYNELGYEVAGDTHRSTNPRSANETIGQFYHFQFFPFDPSRNHVTALRKRQIRSHHTNSMVSTSTRSRITNQNRNTDPEECNPTCSREE
jgi:hypothetical protein